MPSDGHGRHAADRGDLQEVPAALLAQEGQGGLGDPEGAEDVGLDLLAGLLLGDLLDHAEVAVAGVVDHDVEARRSARGPAATVAKAASRSVTSRVRAAGCRRTRRRGRRGCSRRARWPRPARRGAAPRWPTRGRSRATTPVMNQIFSVTADRARCLALGNAVVVGAGAGRNEGSIPRSRRPFESTILLATGVDVGGGRLRRRPSGSEPTSRWP